MLIYLFIKFPSSIFVEIGWVFVYPSKWDIPPSFLQKKFLSGMCTISVFFDVFFVNTGHFSHSIKINRNSPMRAAPLTPLIIWSTYSNPEWNILRSKPLLLQLLVAHWLFTTVVNLGVHKFTLLYKNKWKYFISRTIFNKFTEKILRIFWINAKIKKKYL